jgi:hypothetical protein
MFQNCFKFVSCPFCMPLPLPGNIKITSTLPWIDHLMHVELYLSDLLSSKLPAQVAALDFNELDFPG